VKLKPRAIFFDRLSLDPENARRKYFGIDRLAKSIRQNGLIQSIEVRPMPGHRGKFIVNAGNRRFLAIRLLREQDRAMRRALFLSDGVPCMVRGHVGADWRQLTENTGREDVHPWDLGRKFLALKEKGHTQDEIADRVDRDRAFVSRCIKMYRGLGERARSILSQRRAPPADLALRLASLPPLDDGSPDDARQVKILTGDGAPAGQARGKKGQNLGGRLKRLESATVGRGRLTLPRAARPFVKAAILYLRGETEGFEVSP